MAEHGSSLAGRAFGGSADAGFIVTYESHQDALRFLAAALGRDNAIALLQGPTGAGKTTVARQLAAAADTAAALVDAARLPPRQFLTGMLGQFGVSVVSQQDEQLLHAVDNFASREARHGRPPLLVIDNADRAAASLMSLVNWLAALQAGEAYALRLVLTGRQAMADFARSESLRNIARRHPATWSMNPLSAYEAEQYLRARFAAAGGSHAEDKFTTEVCTRLYELSAGWPGALNRQAEVALERSEELRSAALPRVIVTRDGETIGEYALTQKKYVIGRSELADIIIEDNYASKLHAMLQVYSNAILLSDLNSTNGTRVNSKEVRNTILRSNDVILLGRHRLKIENAPALSTDVQQRLDVADTITMQNLADLRRARARRNLAAIRHGHAG